ncbi:hypothetical protein SAMN04487936_101619 [Halobacillus dabanensis]|uniref:Uncharacterized protein n=1 Tax=Halobacillus dabanensis TaxID=240302 RepID=A0A1I3QBJ2_HALDA|nr:hypothetical protein [Halobacillus dabanensis]SFJ30959.1 hypothetical protein SAMN04487936_101619 [Halobacillus dabanensis]
MDLLQFIKNEGYVSASFASLDGENIQLILKDLASTEDLYEWMNITPTSISYYPYERVPYMVCYMNCLHDESVLKLQLIKA